MTLAVNIVVLIAFTFQIGQQAVGLRHHNVGGKTITQVQQQCETVKETVECKKQ